MQCPARRNYDSAHLGGSPYNGKLGRATAARGSVCYPVIVPVFKFGEIWWERLFSTGCPLESGLRIPMFGHRWAFEIDVK